jgi:mono/diheme cytochrome c family protein
MNLEHSANSLLLGLDNWIYSLYHPYRYRQINGTWERESMPLRVQWGLSRDDFGRLFYTSNSDQLRGDLVPSHYFSGKAARQKFPGIGIQIAKDQSVWPIRVNPGVNRGYQPETLRDDGTLAKFTAACGPCIYRGGSFPAEFQGNAFVCEPGANVVRRNILSEQDGVVTARNAYEEAEFLASTDEIFRPVNLYTGPDGALYVVDMYHGIIQHRLFVTSYLRSQSEDRGLDKVTTYGRIWRVVPEGKPRGPKPNLSRESAAKLVEHLSHPNGWWRDTAQRLLIERQDFSVVPSLEKLAANAESPVTRLHALWSLEGMGHVTSATVEKALKDAHSKVRAAGIRLAESKLKETNSSEGVSLRSKVLALATDASADVQIQLALSLGVMAWDAKSSTVVSTIASNSSFALAREAALFTLSAREVEKAPASDVVKAAPLTAEEQRRFEAGKTMYEVTCLACHQQHGLGQAGLAPPLVGSEWVAGSDKRLIRIVLNGMRGPIQVKGETFELDMPSLGVLDDEQIAAALTYVRREWGHQYPPVDSATVKQVREETAKREDAWTVVDLLKVP